MDSQKVEMIVDTFEYCKKTHLKGGCLACKYFKDECFVNAASYEMAEIITEFYNLKKCN